MCAMTLSPDRDPMGAAITDYLAHGKASKLRVFSSQFDEDEIPVEPDVSIWVYDSKTGECLFRLYWIGAEGSGLEEKLHD